MAEGRSASTRTTVSVVAADLSPVFLRGLVAVLDGWPRAAGVSAASHVAVVRDELAKSPDLLVLDSRMLTMDAGLCRSAREMGASVVLTLSKNSPQDLAAAVSDGAIGLWDREGEAEDLLRTLASALDGRAAVSAAAGAALVDQMAASSDALRGTAADQLTRREMEVLALMAGGASNRGIAEVLFISENTVRNHVRNVLDKLRASTRTEAVVRAARGGLIQLK
ncbi:MAG: response regulator transcription factor [Candidatus Nanopelagicales bacterium]|nr:response regulator transcription factor [Candidatus Nanopelagicales bacterium]MDZ4249948.1 response regulator transcription factor [Candidatus Nanopelagicales bacterium]